MIRTTLAALFALTLASSGTLPVLAQGLPSIGNGSALRSDVGPSIPLIQVHLTGDVPLPGKVSVPPGSRVDDVLLGRLVDLSESGILASGVSNIPLSNPRTGVVLRTSHSEEPPVGSDAMEYDLRNIRLLRADGREVPTDLMAYRMAGDLAMNPAVMDGDVVHVRRMHEDQRTVSVSGAVRTPITLPWRPGDTLEGLLRMAGGVSDLAVPGEVVIHRAGGGDGAPRTSRYDLGRTPADSVSVQANDRVVVPLDRTRRNGRMVSVEGEVMRPGVYPIVDGASTLGEILEAAGGPAPNARLHDVRVRRMGSEPMDGQLLRASDQPLESLEALREEILMDQRVVHADLREGTRSVGGQTVLFDGDVVRVERDERTVRLMGQVARPGFYTLTEGAEVSDYVARAGGYGPAADTARVFVIKSGGLGWTTPGTAPIESGDILFVDRHPFAESTAMETLQLSRGGLDLQAAALEIQRDGLVLQGEALEVQRRTAESNEKRLRIQLIFTAMSTATSAITTYLLIRNR